MTGGQLTPTTNRGPLPNYVNGPAGVVVAPQRRHLDCGRASRRQQPHRQVLERRKFLLEVGGGVESKSGDPGKFNDPHDLAMDADGPSSSPIGETTASRFSIRKETSSRCGHSSLDRQPWYRGGCWRGPLSTCLLLQVIENPPDHSRLRDEANPPPFPSRTFGTRADRTKSWIGQPALDSSRQL